MAQKIEIGSNYFVDFAGGQGLGPGNYFTYASDQDTNFVTLRNTVNQMIDELNGIQGPNSALGLDAVIFNDPRRPVTIQDGLIGIGSYLPTIQDSPNENRIDVLPGTALVGGIRTQQTTPTTLTTVPIGNETNERYLSINTAGTPFLQPFADQNALDLYRFDYNPAPAPGVLSNPTRIVSVMFDGDDYDLLRRRRGTTPRMTGFPQLTFDNTGSNTITRDEGSWIDDGFVTGQTIQIVNTVDNNGTYTVTGSVTATVLTVVEAVAVEIALAANISGGVFLYKDFNQAHERVEAIESLLAGSPSGGESIAFPLGSAATPGISFGADPDTGLFGDGSDSIAITTGGVQSFTVDSNGAISNDIQPRARVRRNAVFNIPSGVWTVLDFDTETTDVGDWWENVTNPDRLTVPYTGFYGFNTYARFDESSVGGGGTANSGQRGIRWTINGSASAEDDRPSVATGDNHVNVAEYGDLPPGTILRVEVFQNSGGTMDILTAIATAVKYA